MYYLWIKFKFKIYIIRHTRNECFTVFQGVPIDLQFVPSN